MTEAMCCCSEGSFGILKRTRAQKARGVGAGRQGASNTIAEREPADRSDANNRRDDLHTHISTFRNLAKLLNEAMSSSGQPKQ